MEEAIGVKRRKCGQLQSNRAVVRYADDFVVFCKTKEDVEEVKEILSIWLAERGLTFSEEKTRIVHLTEGFDFLSFNVKQYPTTTRKAGYKLLIRPSKEAVLKARGRMREIWREMRGKNPQSVCRRLNSFIQGWANYHRVNVATRTFKALDQWNYRRAVHHLRKKHASAGPCTLKWFKELGYLGKLHPLREDNYVFGNKKKGVFLKRFAWFPIERHVLVKGTNSPDDPSLKEYWEKRRLQKVERLKDGHWRRLALRQKGLCPVCGESVIEGENSACIVETTEQVDRHHRIPRKAGGKWNLDNLWLVHKNCHCQIHYAKIRVLGDKPDDVTI